MSTKQKVTNRPPVPLSETPEPLDFRKFLSRLWRKAAVACINTGWFGHKRLKTHIVICGFPRSGTTLMQLMMCSSIADAFFPKTERRALNAAKYLLRNHPVMITKRPNDLYGIDDIRKFYDRRITDVRFVLMIRDPRDVMTSIHKNHPDKYYISPERWRSLYQHVCYVRDFEDVFTVHYETLVSEPDTVQQKMKDFMGFRLERNFSDYMKAFPENFETKALNGLRPLETKNVKRWQKAEHRDRIAYLLQQLPDLPDYLIDLGYEKDRKWVEPYENLTLEMPVLAPAGK